MHMDASTVFELNIFNQTFHVTTSIVTQWFMMAVIIGLTLILTRNLGKVPSKKQTVLEIIVTAVNGLVTANMGSEYKKFFVPYIGTMGIFLCFLNMSEFVGIPTSTKDINVTAAFALMTFVLINANAIRKMGPGGYLKGYLKPYAAMLPLTIIEKLTIPFSLCLRLFCNMLVGAMVLGLVYGGMGHFAFIAPIPVHFFFNVFDALMQVFVFMMLTMVYTRINASSH